MSGIPNPMIQGPISIRHKKPSSGSAALLLGDAQDTTSTLALSACCPASPMTMQTGHSACRSQRHENSYQERLHSKQQTLGIPLSLALPTLMTLPWCVDCTVSGEPSSISILIC